MRYEEFRPDPVLGEVIHRYWFLAGAGAGQATTPQLQPIVPDGRMELILNFADRAGAGISPKLLGRITLTSGRGSVPVRRGASVRAPR